MKGFLFSILAVCAIVGTLKSDELKVVVNGQVFVVTRGGENIKLGDVEISAYDFASTREMIENRSVAASELHEGLIPLTKTTGEAKREADARREAAMNAAFERHDYSLRDSTYKAAADFATKMSGLDLDARWGFRLQLVRAFLS